MLICLSDGYCVKGSVSCNGESYVCRLNPKAGKQTTLSLTHCSELRDSDVNWVFQVNPLRNSACCYFIVCEVVEHE
jgi:hypothetical protein